MLPFDSHMHTTLCKHAQGSIEEYILEAVSLGLQGVTFTCHSPAPNGYSQHIRMAESELDMYYQLVLDAQHKFKGRIDGRVGLESDYVPGFESYLDSLHSRYDFDFILGSVHPQLEDYRSLYFEADPISFAETYYQHQLMMVESGLIDSVAHCDLLRDYLDVPWEDSRIETAVEALLIAVLKQDISIEINTSGITRKHSYVYPNLNIIRKAADLGISITTGSDAHSPNRVGSNFDTVVSILEDVHVSEICRYIQRERRIHVLSPS